MSLIGGGSNRIDIAINATNNASGVIGTVSRDLGGLQAQGSGSGGGMFGGLGNVAALAGVAAGVGMVGSAAYDLGSNAARVEALRTSFESLTAGVGQNSDDLLASLKATSAGAISEENLMLAANKALLLGVADTSDEFTAILAVAKSRGQAMGLDVTQSFDNLVTGVGRGSALILDNLGFSTLQIAAANEAYAASMGVAVDEMDDGMKKAAMLALIMEEAASMGAIPESTLDSYQRVGAEWENLKANLGDTVQPATGGSAALAANVLGAVNEGLDFLQRDTVVIEQRMAEIDAAMQGAQLRFGQNLTLIESGAGSPQVMDAYIESLKELNGLERERSDLQRELAGVTRESSGIWADIGASAEAAAQAQDNLAQKTAALTAVQAAAREEQQAARQLGQDALATALGAAAGVGGEDATGGGGLAARLRASGEQAGTAMIEGVAASAQASAGSMQETGTASGATFIGAFSASLAARQAQITGAGASSGQAWLSGFLAQVEAGIGGRLISILAAALAGPVAQAQSAQASRRGAE